MGAQDRLQGRNDRATGCYGITVCELVSSDLNVILKAVISNVDCLTRFLLTVIIGTSVIDSHLGQC